MHLLRGHFCRSEVQFLLSLENICNRLLVTETSPRKCIEGRTDWPQSQTACGGLHTNVVLVLRHTTLPDGTPQPHHRIVRIPPGESVVLNSAERAPYLLLIEILHGDLDFDPAKRSTRKC
ncbi:hypothetical protein A0H81_04201 [Grifola frondosa]|uniref:Uncharacterized protein n=1 Tax=Grifola frondosa TaxID=5627 RepID=A0A1C7MDX5_GRIFR|nr:hypothetical protein A0H81_04201 [Grifola frondosa]